jgi:carbonic anhydrase
VNAALQSRDKGEQHGSRIQLLVDSILPGLPPPDPRLSPEEQDKQAVESNVRWTIKQISELAGARPALVEGKRKLVGAVYEIATGHVRLLPL